MDRETRKYAAAYLTQMVKEAQEPAAGPPVQAAPTSVDRAMQYLRESPLRGALAGGGLGAALGAAGGGLRSWLQDDEEGDKNDILAGALIGGGLGTGLGAVPGLIQDVRKAATPPPTPEPLADLPSGLGEAIENQLEPMFSPTGVLGGVTGMSLGALGGLSRARGSALRVLPSISDAAAANILQSQFGLHKIPTKGAKGVLTRMVANTTGRSTLRNVLKSLLAKSPRSAGRALKGYAQAAQMASRASKANPYLRLGSLLGLTALGAGAGSYLGGHAPSTAGSTLRQIAGLE